jgi:two-component system, LytTR family, sensor kinase
MRHPTWLASFAAWMLIGTFNVAPRVVANLSAGKPLPRIHLAIVFGSVAVWAVLTPGLLALCRRLPLARWRPAVAIHLACATAIAFLDPVLDTPVVYLVEQPVPEPYRQRLLDELFINVFSYLAVVGVGYALDYRRRLVDQRAHEAELAAQLLRARLDALTAQLRPHFLFNALHSVTALIRTDERSAAIRAVVVLGDLLRETLRSDGSAVVPLARELDWIRSYLELEQLRFQDRLSATVAVDRELEAALVPALVLQPLIETAIRHGVEGRVGTSRVVVSARREADRLCLAVSDDGDRDRAVEAEPNRAGIGLRATRERLAHLFGADHHFEVAIGQTGSRASIAIPFRTEAPP